MNGARRNMWHYINILVALLCTLVLVQTVDLDVYDVTLSTTRQTWQDAVTDSRCDVIGKGFRSDVNITQVRVNVKSGNDGNAFWVAASVDYSRWISITKCMARDVSGRTGGRLLVSDNTLRECFELCNSTFTISRNRCFCSNVFSGVSRFEGVPNFGSCFPQPCMQIRRGSCVFKPVSFSSGNTDLGNCKTVKYKNRRPTYRTTACTAEHILPTYHDHEYKYTGNYLSTFKLNIANGYTSYTINDNILATNGEVNMWRWIGVFRYPTHVWYDKGEQQQEVPFHCLAAVVNRDGTLLPRVLQCNTTLKSACVVSSGTTKASNVRTTTVRRSSDPDSTTTTTVRYTPEVKTTTVRSPSDPGSITTTTVKYTPEVKTTAVRSPSSPDSITTSNVRYIPEVETTAVRSPSDPDSPFTTPSVTSEASPSNNSTWVIVGAVLGSAVVMVIAFVVGCYCGRKRTRTKDNRTPGEHQLYTSLNAFDRSPPAIYDVISQAEHEYVDVQYDATTDYVNGILTRTHDGKGPKRSHPPDVVGVSTRADRRSRATNTAESESEQTFVKSVG